MLWLALLLPALPLQLTERALPCIGPLAIVEGPPQRLMVIHCNTAAQAAAWRRHQARGRAGAGTRADRAQTRHGARAGGARRTRRLAYQFSSHVVLQSEGLLLEVGGSLRLFGAARGCFVRLTTGSTHLATAPRSRMPPRRAPHAWLRWRRRLNASTFPPRPPPLRAKTSCAVCRFARSNRTSDGRDAARARPRDDRRRAGAPARCLRAALRGARLVDLDRALGVRSDPQPLYEPPALFYARLELPAISPKPHS